MVIFTDLNTGRMDVDCSGWTIVFEGTNDKAGGFALIRQSNTEPVFTLRFEADSKENAEKYEELMINKLLEIIQNASKKLAGAI